MKLTTGILAVTMMAGGAWGQTPNVIDNVQSSMKSVEQQKNSDVNAALQATGTSAQKPAPGAPASKQTKPVVVKTTAAPGKPATAKPVVKPASAPAQKATAPASKVAQASAPAVQPSKGAAQASKSASAQTSKPSAVPAPKAAAVPVKSIAPVKPQAPGKPVVAVKAASAPAGSAKSSAAAVPAKGATVKITPKPRVQPQVAKGKDGKPVVTPIGKPSAAATAAKPKPEEKKWAMTGKRDPFFSPVVQSSGSGCSSGKKCLEIGQINVRGVVKSESGFIAVVTNNLNKAYFLRENDPVFNGYVVKITGDSVVFQETVQDKLGKTFTREVVKRLFTPAV